MSLLVRLVNDGGRMPIKGASWRLSNTLDASFCFEALNKAIANTPLMPVNMHCRAVDGRARYLRSHRLHCKRLPGRDRAPVAVIEAGGRLSHIQPALIKVFTISSISTVTFFSMVMKGFTFLFWRLGTLGSFIAADLPDYLELFALNQRRPPDALLAVHYEKCVFASA